MKVRLVCMPFADVGRPAVGVSLLQAELKEAGVDCSVLYPNLGFARQIGLPEYQFVRDLPWRLLATEWLFASSLYGAARSDDDAYVSEVLRASGVPSVSVARLLEIREQVPRFLDRIMTEQAWSDCDVVGFSSFCGQDLASLSLARRIKEHHPGVTVVFGGRNWEAEVGRELHRRFPYVDFVCSGEADISFPALVRALEAGDGLSTRSIAEIGGLTYRQSGRSRSTKTAVALPDMDTLPAPDFTDYFEQLRAHGYSRQFVPALGMENSRGCWWAARRPCAFCGLNGTRTTYRSKSPERFLEEARELTEKYESSCLELVDMVVGRSFFSAVLPELAEHPLSVPLLIQVRATVSLDELRLAARAGVRMQCGIESLSDGVLRVMGKGTTSLQNIRFLKWCRAVGMEPGWPMLYGFPLESTDDYETMCELLPSLYFLQPPTGLGSVIVPRYSLYFFEPERYGLHDLKPVPAYRHLYPFAASGVNQIALFFEGNGSSTTAEPDYVRELRGAYEAWREAHDSSRELRGRRTEAGLVLRDTRFAPEVSEFTLDACDEAIYRECDSIATRKQLEDLLLHRFPQSSAALDSRLTRFLQRKLMLTADDQYLSLALLD
jgi:ribosomal peptide maturation radical SAM protein 1